MFEAVLEPTLCLAALALAGGLAYLLVRYLDHSDDHPEGWT